MYESFYGFSQRPFAVTAQPRLYFAAAAIELARETLARCVERGEGVGLVTGPAGTGKSLLCQVLAEQFRGRLAVALLASGQLCTRRALLQAILFELGLPYRGMEEGDLRLSLIDHLSPRAQPGEEPTAGMLLIVDEAHTLPLRLLEELRLITNLVRNGQPRVRLVLVGGPQLEERFASPKLESFNQRVAARCYLEALDRPQTIDYVRHQIAQVQGQPDRVFTADALDAIYHASDGIPRLVNQVCDHALLLAFAGGVRQLTAAGIEEAWSDLQQLPTPWNASQGAPARSHVSSVVEFGNLDDERSDDLPAAVPFRAAAAGPSPEPAGPLERLQQITAKLSQIDDDAAPELEEDFQPAGNIGPEVELVLQTTSNPFQHAFDEEEVVLDRYTAMETDALANRPLVRSAESRELGALLAPFAADIKPNVAIAPATWPGGVPATSHRPPAMPQHDFAPSEKPPAPAVAALPSDQPRDVPNREVRRDPVLVPVENQAASTPPPEREIANDDDLIVIEDAPEQVVPAAIKATPRARRKEYRQLFAQLRRG